MSILISTCTAISTLNLKLRVIAVSQEKTPSGLLTVWDGSGYDSLDLGFPSLTIKQDSIYWNFCDGWWANEYIEDQVYDVANDPHKNPKFIENYYQIRERLAFARLLLSRSVGLMTCKPKCCVFAQMLTSFPGGSQYKSDQSDPGPKGLFEFAALESAIQTRKSGM